MRYFILLLLIVSNVMALNDVTKPYNFSPRDTLKSSKFNANFDTLYNRINQNNDSTDEKFIRWYDFNSHDSTLRYFKVDTIRSNPNIDSIAGDVKFSGAPTIAGTLTTHAISGTTGTFSGALTASTLNTGNGANELYPMDQDVRTTSNPLFDSTKCKKNVLRRADSTTTTSVEYNDLITNLLGSIGISRTDGTGFTTTLMRNSMVFRAESGPFIFSYRQFTKAILDSTGLFTCSSIKADSLKLGSGSYLKTYLDTTFYDSLFENNVYTGQRTTSRIIQIGKTVTKYQPTLIATTSGGYLTIKGLPSKFRPSLSVGNAIIIFNNSTTILGMYSVITNGLMYIKKIDNTEVDAGNSGVTGSVITWVID